VAAEAHTQVLTKVALGQMLHTLQLQKREQVNQTVTQVPQTQDKQQTIHPTVVLEDHLHQTDLVQPTVVTQVLKVGVLD
jgi:hypothetical protein